MASPEYTPTLDNETILRSWWYQLMRERETLADLPVGVLDPAARELAIDNELTSIEMALGADLPLEDDEDDEPEDPATLPDDDFHDDDDDDDDDEEDDFLEGDDEDEDDFLEDDEDL